MGKTDDDGRSSVLVRAREDGCVALDVTLDDWPWSDRTHGIELTLARGTAHGLLDALDVCVRRGDSDRHTTDAVDVFLDTAGSLFGGEEMYGVALIDSDGVRWPSEGYGPASGRDLELLARGLEDVLDARDVRTAEPEI